MAAVLIFDSKNVVMETILSEKYDKKQPFIKKLQY